MRRVASARTLLAALLTMASVVQAQPTAQTAMASIDANTRLSAAGLQADVRVLRQAYEAMHPGLYRYNSPAQIDAAFAALDAYFGEDRTLAESYMAFSRFAAKIKCGHTYASFFNQREPVAAALFNSPRLPFYFRWLDGRMIVTNAFTGKLEPGYEILAIDGQPVSGILKELMALARADGHNDFKRVKTLEVQGDDRLEAFDVYYPLLHPIRPEGVELSVLTNNGDTLPMQITVPPVDPAHREAEWRARQTSDGRDGKPMWTLTLRGDGVAILDMPSWAMYNSTWNWKSFLQSGFEALAENKIADLVIDLRRNEGGDNVGEVILAHLSDQPIPRTAYRRLVRYRQAPEAVRPYLDTWDPGFMDWGVSAIDPEHGFYTLRRDGDDEAGSAIMPRTPLFRGRVWVLVNGGNSSATFEFANTLQSNRLGILVGQPTGGNRRGINGGAFFFLRLPNSGIELDLPLIGQFPLEAQPDAGLLPDIAVTASVEDIAESRDVELQAVLQRIAQQR